MKAVTFNPASNSFHIKDLPIPRIGAYDVLVKVKACGLNPIDAKISIWKGLVADMDNSWVPGLDVSGSVVEVGKKVTRWKPGDRIFYYGNMLKPHGGYAEYAVQEEDAILQNLNMPHAIAAATPCAGWTAYRCLMEKLRLNTHDSLLILGGAGGVGSFAIQIAKYVGVKNIIATCSTDNMAFVRQLGATHIIDHTKQDTVREVMRITNDQGVTKALDTVGPDNDITAANSLSFNGQMVELVSFARPAKYYNAFMKSLTFHQMSLGGGYEAGECGLFSIMETGRLFTDLVDRGLVEVPLKRIIELEEVPDVLSHMLTGRTVGKIVMEFK